MMDQIEKEETYSDSDTAVTPKKTPMKNAEPPVPQVDFEAELNNVNNIILTNNSHVLPNKVSCSRLQFLNRCRLRSSKLYIVERFHLASKLRSNQLRNRGNIHSWLTGLLESVCRLFEFFDCLWILIFGDTVQRTNSLPYFRESFSFSHLIFLFSSSCRQYHKQTIDIHRLQHRQPHQKRNRRVWTKHRVKRRHRAWNERSERCDHRRRTRTITAMMITTKVKNKQTNKMENNFDLLNI